MENEGDLDEFRLPLGWQGSCSSTSSSKELGRNGNLRNFNDFRLPLGGEVEVLLLLDTSSSPQLRHLSWFKYRCVGFGDRPPSHWWWRNCRISDEYF